MNLLAILDKASLIRGVNESVSHNRIFSFSSRFAQKVRQDTRRTPFNRLAIHLELHGHFLPQPARHRHFTFIPFASRFQLLSRHSGATADQPLLCWPSFCRPGKAAHLLLYGIRFRAEVVQSEAGEDREPS